MRAQEFASMTKSDQDERDDEERVFAVGMLILAAVWFGAIIVVMSIK